MATYVIITNEGIEKLRDKVSPEILQYLEQGLAAAYNERKKEKFKQKLMSFGVGKEDINFIVSCFKTFEMPEDILTQRMILKQKKNKIEKDLSLTVEN